MPLPEKFKCAITNWSYIYDLCRDLAYSVEASFYAPDVIVALARGGWFAGRMMCDFLGINDLISLKVEHYVGTACVGDECRIKYPIVEEMVHGKRALIVDDISDTGKSLQYSVNYVKEFGPTEAKTGALQLLFTSEFTPDYYAEYLEDWVWVVYPWNFIEDMTDLITKMMTKERRRSWDLKTIKMGLKHWYSIEPMYFDIAQPGRLTEILREMERREIVHFEGSGWTLK
jgi:hypoxanthine phosphoribosyltransferase